MTAIAEGTAAPDFTLPRDGGGTVSLSDYRGKTVVLYFYPKDDTSGCTVEAIDFTAKVEDFAKAGAVVIGMSPDPVKAHDKFIKKHGLGIVLAPTRTSRHWKPMASGPRKSMYAANIWASSAPRC